MESMAVAKSDREPDEIAPYTVPEISQEKNESHETF
jgi:hypothetical protein